VCVPSKTRSCIHICMYSYEDIHMGEREKENVCVCVCRRRHLPEFVYVCTYSHEDIHMSV